MPLTLNHLAAAVCAATIPCAMAVPALSATEAAPDSAGQAVAALVLTQQNAHTGAILAQTTLTCHPTGGTHPQAGRACTTLTQVDGDLTQLSTQASMCPMIY